MSRIDFYHLQTQNLENILPSLVEKAYETGKNIKIMVGLEENVEKINALLWAYNSSSFLPHGSKKDGFADMQPIYISAKDDNPNNSSILFLVDGAKILPENLNLFERVLNVFDGNNSDRLNEARQFWKNLKETDMELNYWQQSSNGKWEKK